MEPKSTITLGQFFVSSDNQTATAAGGTDTAVVTFVSVTDATKSFEYTTTDPGEIEALAGASVWSQQMILVPAATAATAPPSGETTTGSSTDSSDSSDSSAETGSSLSIEAGSKDADLPTAEAPTA